MPSVSTNDKAAVQAMRKFLAHHETFQFALQTKMEELARYAQRKDASQFVIDKGNKELKEAAHYLNGSKECVDALFDLIEFDTNTRTIRRLDKQIKALKKESTSWHLNP